MRRRIPLILLDKGCIPLATDVKKRVKSNIKRFREEAGLTQQGLADRMGVGLRYVSTLEQNARNLSLKSLERVAVALRVDVSDLVADPVAAKDARKAAAQLAARLISQYIESLD